MVVQDMTTLDTKTLDNKAPGEDLGYRIRQPHPRPRMSGPRQDGPRGPRPELGQGRQLPAGWENPKAQPNLEPATPQPKRTPAEMLEAVKGEQSFLVFHFQLI